MEPWSLNEERGCFGPRSLGSAWVARTEPSSGGRATPPRRWAAGLVDAADEVDHDLAGAVVVDDLDVAEVAVLLHHLGPQTSEARRGEARRGEARLGEARRGEARRGEARRGEAPSHAITPPCRARDGGAAQRHASGSHAAP